MRKFLPILLVMTGLISHAQNLTTPADSVAAMIIKDEFYNNKPLNEVIADLQKKYKFKIGYNVELLKKYRVSYWFDNTKLLDGIKGTLKETKDLTFYIDEANVIQIVPKTATQVLQNARKEFDTRYRGQPTRTDFTLMGKVVERKTNESMPFATVAVLGSKIGVQTNVDGYYTLLKVPSDTVTILVSYVGYKNATVHLSPQTPLQNFIIEIEPGEQELEEVMVMGEKTEVLKANEIVGMIKMTPKNLAKLPNIGERDPFRAFQLMPGVSASNESSSGLYVRGGTPDQTLVLYDGFTVYHVDHLFGFFSAFNYNALKDIQLYKGGFDAKFGGRISAVAEITGKDGNKNQFNMGADLSLLSMNGFIETPLNKKTTLLIAARRSYQGALYEKIFSTFTSERQTNVTQPGLGGRPGGPGRFGNNATQDQTAKSYFYDLNAKLTWNLSKKDIVTWSLYNGTDKMDNSSASSFNFGRQTIFGASTSTNDVSAWGNLGSSVKWSRRWNDKLYSNMLVSYSNFYSNRDNTRSVVNTIPATDSTVATTRNINIGQVETNDLKDFTAKIDFEYKLTPHNQLEFGVHATANTIHYNYVQNDTVNVLSKNDKGTITSFYVQDQIRLLDTKLLIKPGIRANYFDVTKKWYVEPRLSATYALNERVKLKMALGRYYQFAKQINREDLTQGNRSYWLLADGDALPVTKSNHLILGGSYEFKEYLVDVELYQKNNVGITEYTLRFVPQIRQGLSVQETFFNGDETVRGMDVLVQRKFGKFNGWIGYTLSEAVRDVTIFSERPYYSDQDVRHQFKFIGSYRWKNIDFALTQIISSGRPYTSIVGAYQINLLDGSVRSFTMPSDKNASRFSSYNRLDISATYNARWGSVGLSVFNLYNRKNVWYKRFEVITEGDESVLQTTNVNYLGFTPNLTISWKLR
ncbi:TonB-dependent receptor [Runella rosea]|uniref:TonB-dependent receptor n=1 Tax=Runella rosea TaxID=2259595 RepID=A0A344TGJ3_9BACT|nr:carboxypeptidase-like regulatory domain-containing protein [Runella rosea]AXE17764.1 TonB-dependent receptor [Runella rosea]